MSGQTTSFRIDFFALLYEVNSAKKLKFYFYQKIVTKSPMKKLFCLLLLFPMVFTAQQNTILPHPVVFKSMPGYIELDRSLSMDFSSLSSTIIQQLKTTGAYYHNLQLIDRTNKPLVIFKKLVNVPLDSYSINVNKQIIISYSSPKACYFAFHSLMQLIKSDDNGHLIINNCFVDDYPK